MKLKKTVSSLIAAILALSCINVSAEPTEDHNMEGASINWTPPDAWQSSNYAEPYSANGITIPFPEYTSMDTYFSTRDGDGCNCHGWCNENSNCYCKKFDGGSQCMGFANYVYYKTHNNTYRSGKTSTQKNFSLSAASAKSLFLGTPIGTFARVETKTGYPHAFAIVKTTPNEITIYHANYWSQNCIVSYDSFTWEEFVDRFPYLSYYVV